MPPPATATTAAKIKGSWTPQEDATLVKLVEQHGPRNWSLISSTIPGRSGKSCRLRWCNQLSPDVEHRPFTREEDDVIVRAHAVHGNKWSTISRLLPGRTDNAIKNYWNSTLRRRGVTGEGVKRASVDGSTGSSQSDPGFRSVTKRSGIDSSTKRRCLPTPADHGSCNGCNRVETVLTLLPPGEMKEGGDDVDGKSTVEMEDTSLVKVMKRMIAEEVRAYINELRAKGGVCVSSGPGLEPSAQK